MNNLKFSLDNIKKIYQEKLFNADTAISQLKQDIKLVTCGGYSSTPNTLVKSFVNAVKNKFFNEKLTIFLSRSSGEAASLFKDLQFLELVDLEIPNAGGALGTLFKFETDNKLNTVKFIPAHFSRMSSAFNMIHKTPPDVHMFQVSPMDQSGYFSFGVEGSYSIPMSKIAKKVIVEVNKFMPRTFGEGVIHINDIDLIVENDEPLGIMEDHVLSNESQLIGDFILPFIKDGSCIQLGIGGIPDVIGHKLLNLNDLGIHTELLWSSLTDLIINGNVTNKFKNTNRYSTVFNVCLMPSQGYYDYLNNNPTILCYPASYVNDPAVIMKNDNFVSVNSFVEIDLLGQVASESINWHQITGTGGQVDFIRGATMSKGGKSFLAAESTTKNGTISKIVPRLNNIVTTARTDVEYVVTEYGCEYLQGQNSYERAMALINLAHPSFRDALKFEAQKMGLI